MTIETGRVLLLRANSAGTAWMGYNTNHFPVRTHTDTGTSELIIEKNGYLQGPISNPGIKTKHGEIQPASIRHVEPKNRAESTKKR